MRFRTLLLVVISVILIFAAMTCANAEHNSMNLEEMSDMQLTKEYMMEHCQLTEADFSGIDFDDFVSHFKLTVDTLDEFGGKYLLELYRHDKEIINSIDYTFIYQQASGKLSPDDIPLINAVIWELHIGNRNSNIAADFETLAVYGGEGYCLDCCNNNNKIAELSESDMRFIRQAILDNGITSWENKYMGTSEGTTGNFAWSIGFRLNTGRCCKYSGSGVIDSGTPDTMSVFCKALWKHFVTDHQSR